MTFGSLFAGAGGIDIGLERAGLECRWQVEIDAKANSVRRRHWPDVKHYEDVRTFKKAEPVDLICGGFPCQDLSVAGNRKGLSGNRSGLWWEMLRIIKKQRPSYVLWENVAGLLSSDGGRDFERVIGSLAECGYYGCCRILDAQHFGVPQRRRRVFGLFACESRVGSGAERCREILAVTEGVQRDYPKGGEAREDIAGTLGGGSGSRGWCPDTDRMTFVPKLSPALKARDFKGPSSDGDGDGAPLIAHSLTANGFDASEDGTGRGTPIVIADTVRSHPRPGSNSVGNIAFTCKDYGADSGDLAPTLRAMGHDGSHANAGGQVAVSSAMAGVRRLTPRECERLMSWPDDWTRYGHDGKEIADGPRYRMIGNGVVSNCVEWIGRRLMESHSHGDRS